MKAIRVMRNTIITHRDFSLKVYTDRCSNHHEAEEGQAGRVAPMHRIHQLRACRTYELEGSIIKQKVIEHNFIETVLTNNIGVQRGDRGVKKKPLWKLQD